MKLADLLSMNGVLESSVAGGLRFVRLSSRFELLTWTCLAQKVAASSRCRS